MKSLQKINLSQLATDFYILRNRGEAKDMKKLKPIVNKWFAGIHPHKIELLKKDRFSDKGLLLICYSVVASYETWLQNLRKRGFKAGDYSLKDKKHPVLYLQGSFPNFLGVGPHRQGDTMTVGFDEEDQKLLICPLLKIYAEVQKKSKQGVKSGVKKKTKKVKKKTSKKVRKGKKRGKVGKKSPK